jgi:hypothetical protein
MARVEPDNLRPIGPDVPLYRLRQVRDCDEAHIGPYHYAYPLMRIPVILTEPES